MFRFTCLALLVGGLFFQMVGCSGGRPVEEKTAAIAKQPADSVGSESESSSESEQASKPAIPAMAAEAFRMAAYDGNLPLVRQGLDSGVDINAVDPDQKLTALHMAAYNGHAAIVKLLVERGATVDALDHEGKSALTHACTGPFADTVEVLLAGGADVNLPEGTEGFTPLMMAAGLGQQDVVRVLLSHNADKTLRDQDGDLAVDHARNSKHLAIVELFSAR